MGARLRAEDRSSARFSCLALSVKTGDRLFVRADQFTSVLIDTQRPRQFEKQFTFRVPVGLWPNRKWPNRKFHL
jgi:hypothetical protein